MDSLTTGYITACTLGAMLGFQGSVSPGPLQAIIISETLSNGIKSSWRAAIIPAITDPFALVIALFFVSSVPNTVLAIISFLGALLLGRLAWLQFRTTEDDFVYQKKPRLSFWTIWFTNFFNPNLWIFSFAINAVQIHDFYVNYGFWVAAAYILAFDVLIFTGNLGTAYLVAKLKELFNAKWLVRVNRCLSLSLFAVAVYFVYMGFADLGLVPRPGGSAEPAATEVSSFVPDVISLSEAPEFRADGASWI